MSEHQWPLPAGKATGLQDRVLRLISGAFCDCRFSWNALEMLGVRQGFSGAELSVAHVQLRGAGELTAVRHSGGQTAYALTATGLHRAYGLSPFYPSNTHSESSDGYENGDGVRGGAWQMFRFLVHAAKQPLPLTRSGQVTARALSQAASRLGMASEAVSFWLKASLGLGLLAAEPGGARLCCAPDALTGWLAKGLAGMDAALYRLWLAEHLVDEPLLRHLGWLGHLANSRPAPLGELARELARIAGAAEVDDAALWQRWALPLAALGWALLAEQENGLYVCTLSVPNSFIVAEDPAETQDMEETEDTNEAARRGRMVWCIQPDYEVWVTDGLQDAASLWQLALLCEERLGEEGCYVLTPAAWKQALAATGGSGDAIINLLRERSLDGIPDNVLAALIEWTGASDKQAADGMMAKTTLHVTTNPPSAPDRYPLLPQSNGLGKGLGEGQSKGLGNRLAGRLADRLARLPDIRTPEESTFNPPKETSPVVERLPAADELFPNLRAIPASWLKDCRAYHTTTRQLIIRQAMAWKTFLQIETETEQVQVLPCELVCDERGTLVVEGWVDGEAAALPLAADWRLGIRLPELAGLGE